MTASRDVNPQSFPAYSTHKPSIPGIVGMLQPVKVLRQIVDRCLQPSMCIELVPGRHKCRLTAFAAAQHSKHSWPKLNVLHPQSYHRHLKWITVAISFGEKKAIGRLMVDYSPCGMDVFVEALTYPDHLSSTTCSRWWSNSNNTSTSLGLLPLWGDANLLHT